jgi:hypothetical protein
VTINVAVLADGAQLRYGRLRYACYSVWLYSARGSLLWRSAPGAISSIRTALPRMRKHLSCVDLDRDEQDIRTDARARRAIDRLCTEFGGVSTT